MATKPSDRWHVLLDIRNLDANETALEDSINSILKLAPQSPLYIASAAIQAAVADLGTNFGAFKAAGVKAAASMKQAKLDLTAETTARNTTNKSLLVVKTLSEAGAKSKNDLTSMAWVAWNGKPPAPAFLPPESLDIHLGKKGAGWFRASAHEVGTTKRQFAAEWSPDPVGTATWTILPGKGKSRKLTGKSGTSVWVRFALVRAGQQSEWGTPVLVTFP